MTPEEFVEYKYPKHSPRKLMFCYSEIIEMLNEFSNINCIHEYKSEHDKRYPYRPLRCQKCGYEP